MLGDSGRRIGLNLGDDRLQLFDANTMEPVDTRDGVRWPLRLTAAGELWWVDADARIRRNFLHESRISLSPESLTSDPDTIRGCHLSPDHRQIFVGLRDAIALHDATSGAALLQIDQPRNATARAAFHPDGGSFVTFTLDLQLHRWDRTTGALLATAPTGAEPLHVAYSPDGNLLAVTTNSGEVEIRHGTSLELLHRLSVTSASVSPVAFSPDGRRLVIGASSGTVQVFATSDWREVTSLVIDALARPEQRDLITQLAFSAAGDTLTVATEGGRAKVWQW